MVTGNPVGGSPVLITVNHDMSLSVRPDVRDFLRRCEAGGGGEETNGNGGGDEDRDELYKDTSSGKTDSR